MSIGRAMGDWLADTVEAVEFTALKVEQARAAPKLVMRELHAYSMGLVDETGSLMASVREKGDADRASSMRSVPTTGQKRPAPRPVIRGGKSPTQGKGSRS